MSIRRTLVMIVGIGIAATLLALWQQGRLVIFFTQPTASLPVSCQQATTHKFVKLHYYGQDGWHTQEIKAVWHPHEAVNAATLLTQLAQILLAEKLIAKQLTITTFTDNSGRFLYIDCNRSPVAHDASIDTKIAIMQSFARTIGNECPTIQALYILVNHEPIEEIDLDLTIPWPVDRHTP